VVGGRGGVGGGEGGGQVVRAPWEPRRGGGGAARVGEGR